MHAIYRSTHAFTECSVHECVCVCKKDALSKTRNHVLASAVPCVPVVLCEPNIDFACRAGWVRCALRWAGSRRRGEITAIELIFLYCSLTCIIQLGV